MGLGSLTEPVTLGIALGLFAGKRIGVFGLMYLTIRLGLARMPAGANYGQLYGVAAMAGIGFTMSLFIGGLAFQHSDFEAPIRLGVLLGSIASALFGYAVLLLTSRRADERACSSEKRGLRLALARRCRSQGALFIAVAFLARGSYWVQSSSISCMVSGSHIKRSTPRTLAP